MSLTVMGFRLITIINYFLICFYFFLIETTHNIFFKLFIMLCDMVKNVNYLPKVKYRRIGRLSPKSKHMKILFYLLIFFYCLDMLLFLSLSQLKSWVYKFQTLSFFFTFPISGTPTILFLTSF